MDSVKTRVSVKARRKHGVIDSRVLPRLVRDGLSINMLTEGLVEAIVVITQDSSPTVLLSYNDRNMTVVASDIAEALVNCIEITEVC